jgi:ribose transport system permease protein
MAQEVIMMKRKPAQKLSDNLLRFVRESGILSALIIMVIVGAIISPHFLKVANLVNVIRLIAISGILGIGMTFVILTSGIDLSVGAIIGMVSVVGAGLMRAGYP